MSVFARNKISLFFALVIFSFNLFATELLTDAHTSTIYGVNHLKAVGDGKDKTVEKLSTGVCSIGPTKLGFACCSGFAIGKDMVMTNFHCLSCLYEVKEEARARARKKYEETKALNASLKASGLPTMPNPINFLIKLQAEITNNPKELSQNKDIDLNYVNFALLDKDVKFNRTARGTQIKVAKSVLEASYRVKELLAFNKELDYIVIKIERELPESSHIFTLDSRPVLTNQKLLSISHPGRSPFPSMKVYDSSEDCKLARSNVVRPGVKEALGHQCDTNGGSSGSPLIDRSTHRVVGLHNMGGARSPRMIFNFNTGKTVTINQDYKDSYNAGIKMEAIVKDLSAQAEFPNDSLTVD